LDREDPKLLEANIVVSPTAEPKQNGVEGPDLFDRRLNEDIDKNM
jgi:hypothetical protein